MSQEVTSVDVPELVGRAGTGDVDAFTELVRRYQAMVFGYAHARLADTHLAEDTAQQAFIAAWRGLDGLKEPHRFGDWLSGIVRFECSHAPVRRPGARRFSAITQPRAGPCRGVPRGVRPRPGSDLQSAPGRARGGDPLLPSGSISTRGSRVSRRAGFHRQQPAAHRQAAPPGRKGNPHERRHTQRIPSSDDFAGRIGEIIRTQGPIIDARFSRDQRPRVLNALTVGDADAGHPLLAEAIQHLDDTIVRCIVPDGRVLPTDAILRVTDTGGPVSVPLDHATVAKVIDASGGDLHSRSMTPTGIKAIDLLCPLPEQGRIALVGDAHTGKVVLVEELIQRLGASGARLSIHVFVETPDEVTTINALEYRMSASIEAICLPVTDSSREALADLLSRFDVVIAFSSQLARQRLYPAIDAARPSSRLLDTDALDPAHGELAATVRTVLTRGETRAEMIRRFLTHPFYVAEEFTGRPGAHVPLAETMHGCTMLLDDEDIGLAPDDLYMIGALPPVS